MCGQACKTRRGFTLAEVVVAVAIIGTLATLTINTYFVDGDSQKNQYVASLKKVYAELSYATDQIKANNGGTMIGFGESTEIRLNKYCSSLKCSKTCMQGHVVDQGCFNAQSVIKTLNGQNYWVDNTDYNAGGMVLADGTLVYLAWTGYSTCDFTDGGVTYCTYMHVDVNGFKGPNIVGKDIFTFYITKDGFIPVGSTGTYSDYNTYCDTASVQAVDGNGCAGRVLKEGKMLY